MRRLDRRQRAEHVLAVHEIEVFAPDQIRDQIREDRV